MTPKRDVLIAICETPGWQPPDDSSSIVRSLQELQGEGWIAPRLDGYEATPQALDAYPKFETQKDIRDLSAGLNEPEPNHDTPNGVPEARVVSLLVGLLHEVPLPKLLNYISLTPAQLPVDKRTWETARDLARRMR